MRRVEHLTPLDQQRGPPPAGPRRIRATIASACAIAIAGRHMDTPSATRDGTRLCVVYSAS